MSAEEHPIPEYLLLAARIGGLDPADRTLLLRKLFEWFRLHTGHDGSRVSFDDFVGAIGVSRDVDWRSVVFSLEEVTAYFYVHGKPDDDQPRSSWTTQWSDATSDDTLATFVVCAWLIGCANRVCQPVDSATVGLALRVIAMALDSNRLTGADAAIVLRSMTEITDSGLADWIRKLIESGQTDQA